jgi:hypothetical protein
MEIDTSSQESIRKFAREIQDKYDHLDDTQEIRLNTKTQSP